MGSLQLLYKSSSWPFIHDLEAMGLVILMRDLITLSLFKCKLFSDLILLLISTMFCTVEYFLVLS